MDIEKYNYIWTTEKDKWVLLKDEENYYMIFNKANSSMLLISNEILKNNLVNKMLSEKIKVYDDILDAINDANNPYNI